MCVLSIMHCSLRLPDRDVWCVVVDRGLGEAAEKTHKEWMQNPVVLSK
jgi:hypothetical protein